MALRLTIVSQHGPKLGTHSVKEFGANGGTIGRSLECDWALPDPKRYLSSRHASIDFRSGSYYIVDTSMNGVYVNNAEQPVGRGKPQRLFDGDRLRIGEYEIVVEIDEDPIAPLIDEDHVDPVDLAQRVEAPEPTGNDLVDAYEITGVGIEMLLTDDELETLSPPPKSKGAYFEIVDDDRGATTRMRSSDSSAPAAARPAAPSTQPDLSVAARASDSPAAGRLATQARSPAASPSSDAATTRAGAAPARAPAATAATSSSATTTSTAAMYPSPATQSTAAKARVSAPPASGATAATTRAPAPAAPTKAANPAAPSAATPQKRPATAGANAARPAQATSAAAHGLPKAAPRATAGTGPVSPAHAANASAPQPLRTGTSQPAGSRAARPVTAPAPQAAGANAQAAGATPRPAATATAQPTAAKPRHSTPSLGTPPPAARTPTQHAAGGATPGQAAGAPADGPLAAATPLHAARAPDLEAFFRGAGVSARVPPQQVDAFLFRLGQVVRAMILGITESLHLRAQQKNSLRLASTTIQPQDNNPLKLSAGLEETFANLLLRDSSAHLAPVDAVREAFDDIQLHQQLLLKATRAALEAFVARLDPDELEQKFTRGRSNVLVNAANRLKYWDLYKDLYDVVAHHPPGELPMQFLEDFAQAYERELAHIGNEAAPAARELQAG